MQQTDAWLWSEAFTGMAEGLMKDPQQEWAARRDWPKHRERLEWWIRQIESARELYRQGHTEALTAMCDYWRTIAEDIEQQVRIACETYRQLDFRADA
jgi:hypothetical protein